MVRPFDHIYKHLSCTGPSYLSNHILYRSHPIYHVNRTSLLEIISCPAVAALKDGSRAPGDFSFDPLGFSKKPEAMKKLQINELKNGRLAMMAFSGFVFISIFLIIIDAIS
jgi:hypothetical protein